MDAVREDMAVVEVTEDVEDSNKWRWKICCGNLWDRMHEAPTASLTAR